MQLYTVVASVLSIDEEILNEESNATNTPNWDSLRHIELVLAVEGAYGVRFSMPEISGMRNLADMRDVLIAKGVTFEAQEPLRKTA